MKTKDRKSRNHGNNSYSLNNRVDGSFFTNSLMTTQAFFNASNSAPVQAKLTIGEPNDEYEKEADSVADQVMRTTDSEVTQRVEMGRVQRKSVQRKCKECEVKDKLQREEDEENVEVQPKKNINGAGNIAPPGVTRVLRSPGRALDSSVRSFMEPRFRHNFSQVRVHTNDDAADSAKSINAKAYTSGNNIVFGEGQYKPESTSGKNLIAHELTHTIQQNSGSSIRRAAVDYQIRDLPPNTARFPTMIFFDRGSHAIEASEQTKINTFATGSTATNATLKGIASEDGGANSTPVATNRANTVDTALGAAGHTGTRTTTTDITSGLGNIDYRKFRAVEIIPTGASSSVPPTPSAVPCSTQTNYPTPLDDGITEAKRVIDIGINRLSASPRTAATNGSLQTFFRANNDATANTVHDKLQNSTSGLKKHVHDMTLPARHNCLNVCNNVGGTNRGCPNGVMTMCPDFWTDSLTERADLLIHEGAHGAGQICSKDHAYDHTRLFAHLTTALALQNSDSYLLFLKQLAGQSVSFGPSTADTTTGFDALINEDDRIEKSIAWLEKYLIGTYIQLGLLYKKLVEHHDNSTSWNAGFYRNMMTLLETHFPELEAPPSVISANRGDLMKIAAIHDRYRIMRNIYRGSPLNLQRVGTGTTTSWQSGPGVDVNVGDDFFTLNATPMPQVLFLLAKLVSATPHISGAFESRYVNFLEAFRVSRTQPAPPP